MKIGYVNRRIEKKCKNAKREWGAQIGSKVLQRLAELAAFATLADVPHVPPQRCHMWVGSPAKFSVDLTQNYRLIFLPSGDYKTHESTGIEKRTVVEIEIYSVEDPH